MSPHHIHGGERANKSGFGLGFGLSAIVRNQLAGLRVPCHSVGGVGPSRVLFEGAALKPQPAEAQRLPLAAPVPTAPPIGREIAWCVSPRHHTPPRPA